MSQPWEDYVPQPQGVPQTMPWEDYAQQTRQTPVTAANRVQAGESGILRGGAYLAGMIPDVVPNIAGLGTAAYDAARHYIGGTDWADLPRPPQPNAVSRAITGVMDKSPITTTQLARPDDAASRYLATATSVIPGVLAGTPNLTVGSGLRGVATAAPPAMAGQAVAEAKPFKSEGANTAAAIAAQLATGLMMPRIAGALDPTDPIKNQAVQEGQAAGYEFPPATTNPSGFNRTIEGAAGKANVQQHATLNNQGVTDALARSDMRVKPGKGPITDLEIADAKAAAAPGYDALRAAGTVEAPQGMAQQLSRALSKNTGASRLAPALGDKTLETIVSQLQENKSFDASDAMDTISTLRDKAGEAFRAGNSGAGRAYRGVSKVIEDALEQGVSDPELLANYRTSRTQFARIGTVEEARNATNGHVDAVKLAALLKDNEPLSGGLLTAARAAGQAPKAFAVPNASAGVNHFNFWGGLLGGSALAHEALPGHWGLAPLAGVAAYQGGRTGARMWALGPGQSNALPRLRAPIDPLLLGGATAAASRPAQ